MKKKFKEIIINILTKDENFDTTCFLNLFNQFVAIREPDKFFVQELTYSEKVIEKDLQPILTEDERVILRNIQQEWKTIFRGNLGTLELHNGKGGWTAFYPMSHLFNFIKER